MLDGDWAGSRHDACCTRAILDEWMTPMTAAASIATSNTVVYQVPSAPVSDTGLTFRDVLSDMNPLQYLPVVGTLYRAVTGDTIPRPLREAGSLLVSGLMGGPAGVVANLAVLGLEKLTGIDLEDLEQSAIAALTPGVSAPVAPSAPPDQGAQDLGAAVVAPASPAGSAEAVAWTAAQLAAYGVVQGPGGELRQGGLSGADVLNALQLRETAAGKEALATP
jgi:hypothetical protein